jgi:hypothetical protein
MKALIVVLIVVLSIGFMSRVTILCHSKEKLGLYIYI